MDASRGVLPLPALDLLTELRSCALDAELTRITGKWGLVYRENHLAKSTGLEAVSRKFRHVRNGGTFSPRHLERLQRVYPRSRLTVSQEHPLGQVLTDPSLPREWLVARLGTLKTPRVRICAINEFTSPRGVQMAVPRTWGNTLIDELATIGTPESLFALVCGIRIAQIDGNAYCDIHAEVALIKMLPIVVGKSLHLQLGSHALKAAVEFFLSWEPYASMRLSVLAFSPKLDFRNNTWLELESMRDRAVQQDRIPEDLLNNSRIRTEKIVAAARMAIVDD